MLVPFWTFFFEIIGNVKSFQWKIPLSNSKQTQSVFELLLTYQELLYFNFCLDFHMFCMYFKEFQSASAMKSSNLSKDCVWWLEIYFQVFLFRCFYINIRIIKRAVLVDPVIIFHSNSLPLHCVHNCNQPYDEMHQGHWLKIKFGFPQTGKGSPKIFEMGWQTPEIHKINSFFK